MQNEKLETQLDVIIRKANLLKFIPNSRDEKEEYLKLLSITNYCLDRLDLEYREIIERSYLDSEYEFWWVDKYCKTSFYRKREKAISSFVQLFDLIYENYPHFSTNITNAIF